MAYAKIDEQGNVVKFPYRLRPQEERNIPSDVVAVDTKTNKLSGLKWYEGMWYDEVRRVGDTYQATYVKGNKKYSSPEEKRGVLAMLVGEARSNSLAAFNSGKITEGQHQANINILDSINVNDESTYDLYNNIVL